MNTAQLEQRRAALKTANEIRCERAAVKRELFNCRNSREALDELVKLLALEPLPRGVACIRLYDALDACRRIGSERARRIMVDLRKRTGGTIRENRLIGELTPRERKCLAEVLRTFKVAAP